MSANRLRFLTMAVLLAVGLCLGTSSAFAADSQAVWRLHNSLSGDSLLTVDRGEVSNLLGLPQSAWVYEGVGFYTDTSASQAVYRFRNNATGIHFYTADEAEKARVIALGGWAYENVAFYVGSGATPVYRFFNNAKGMHYYTAVEAEMNQLKDFTSSGYAYEGPIWMVTDGPNASLSGTGSISGTVTDPNGAAISNIWVRATSTDDSRTYGGFVAADGTYTIESVAAGEYLVTFSIFPNVYTSATWKPEYYDNAHAFADAVAVTVADVDVPNIDAQLDTAASMNTAPVLDAIGNRSVVAGSYLAFTVKGTDADVPAQTLTYRLVGAPAGATIGEKTGSFFWVPNVPGVYSATVEVSDGIATDSETIAITVQSAVWRFYNKVSGTHFYTADASERNRVLSTMSATYNYEGVAYTLGPTSNTVPLYRFYNKRTGTHLYTADENEKNRIVANLSETYQLDGVAYYVSMSGGQAVHRFYSPTRGVHFYSADPNEIANVKANLASIWQYEGPAYYVGQ